MTRDSPLKKLLVNDCKHDLGWCAIKRIYIYIPKEGRKVQFGFNRRGESGRYGYILKCICNKRCGATRTIHIKGSVMKKGIIKPFGEKKGEVNL